MTEHVHPADEMPRRSPPIPAQKLNIHPESPKKPRVLTPDLARGIMLLCIAIANSAGIFLARTPGLEADPEGMERGMNAVLTLLVHARSFPVFVLVFGYSLVLFIRHRQRRGDDHRTIRRTLTRRSIWLVLFGAVHGTLLYAGDFLGAYGILGLLFVVVLMNRGERFHRLAPCYLGVVGLCAAVYAVLTSVEQSQSAAIDAATPYSLFPSASAPDYLSAVSERLTEWPVHTLILTALIFHVWIGVWAARNGILEHPEQYRRLLWTAVTIGLTLSMAGALPMALLSADLWHTNSAAADWARMLYEVTGSFGAIGYLALLTLVAGRIERKRSTGPIVRSLSALGRRSLSAYLFQSIAWLLLAASFTLALPQRTDSPLLMAIVCATGVWLITLIGAEWMRRRNLQGPMEVLLRHLSHGSATRPTPRSQR
ncbi:DUF418 domain-containing protein [Haloglycomyces albus]|uniref:DUF418 domain-containing protein n=1 Tax=Haloglycomyces albus TaxID=526067 RepID=UPI00046D685D|nr:DUF418 domain-containing protein [Haloglycomyces albus]